MPKNLILGSRPNSWAYPPHGDSRRVRTVPFSGSGESCNAGSPEEVEEEWGGSASTKQSSQEPLRSHGRMFSVEDLLRPSACHYVIQRTFSTTFWTLIQRQNQHLTFFSGGHSKPTQAPANGLSQEKACQNKFRDVRWRG